MQRRFETMAYFGADIKNIIAEILEAKKSKGGVKNLYFVGCGGSLGALYPAKTFMEKECASIKSASEMCIRDRQSWEKKRELLSLF